jgi:predicted homoserine dehydrogenase-like protein
MYKPYHLIGLELGISVASVALRKEATGATGAFRGDVVACAKRTLAVGEVLDGEGGFTAYGKLMPATESLRIDALPIGLAHQLTLKNAIQAGQPITWKDVAYDPNHHAIRIRRLMEAEFK